MRYQESAARLEKLQAGFKDTTKSFEMIYEGLKLVTPVEIPQGAPQTAKYAASAAIVSEMTDLMREAANPDSIQVAVQLAKIGDKIRLGLPGGALLSREEMQWINDPKNAGTPAPGNLFYLLAQDQLASTGELKFSYDVNLASSSFQGSLRSTLKREIGEELSQEASERVSIREFLPGERTTTLSTVKLPSVDSSRLIAGKLVDKGVTIDDNGTLRGVYTVVTERVAAAHAPLSEIATLAKDNEEAKGVRIKTLKEMLELSYRTTDSIETFQNFKGYYQDRHGSDGVRNPSTTWGLALLTGWLKSLVIAADPYREGARGNPLEDKV